MVEKIVQRVLVTPDDLDLVIMVDHIEQELDLSTGEKSVRRRLSELLSEGQLSDQSAEIIRDVVARLARIEELLIAHGFETAKDTYDR